MDSVGSARSVMETHTDPSQPDFRDRYDAQHELRPHRWRGNGDRRYLRRRQTGEKSVILLLVISATIFCVLRKAMSGTRQMLVEVLRFAWQSQQAYKGFSARFVVADFNGIRLQADVRLETADLLASYLEAAVNGSVSETRERGGAASERSFSLFSFGGEGRIDFTIRASASNTHETGRGQQAPGRKTGDATDGLG
ncbi:hypothetical protein, conserved [Eimeria praecox]|uniref:Uncharacterized protein n=1 Tax=Eimeria praecox TaxID=51316 RepID=U6H2C7_9EIME|nr:hypothetical protein, conserved [Eimeria praecox]